MLIISGLDASDFLKDDFCSFLKKNSKYLTLHFQYCIFADGNSTKHFGDYLPKSPKIIPEKLDNRCSNVVYLPMERLVNFHLWTPIYIQSHCFGYLLICCLCRGSIFVTINLK